MNPGIVAVLVAAIAALSGPACSSGAGSAADAAAPDRMVPPELWVYLAASTLGNRVGILSLRPATGALSVTDHVDGPTMPSDLAWSRDARFLYAVGLDQLAAFAVDRSTGRLSPINLVALDASGLASLTLDPTGRWITVVDPAGHLSVMSVREDGGVGARAFTTATPTMHAQVVTDPTGRFVFVLSCNDSLILRHTLDATTGQLVARPPHAELPGGRSARRLLFHPSGSWAYGLHPADGTVTAFRYDGTTGALREPRTVAFLPDPDSGPNACPMAGRLVIHPSGKFLYATSPEGGGRVAIFTLDPATGVPTLVGQETYYLFRGADAADVDPSGSVLLVGNGAGGLQVFRIDLSSGRLAYLDAATGAQGARFVGVFPP